MKNFIQLFFTISLVLFFNAARSQNLGIQGRLTDDSSRPLPKVYVNVSSVSDSSLARSVYSDSLGAFIVNGLETGQYRLTFSLAGFKTGSVTVTLADSSLVLQALQLPRESPDAATATKQGPPYYIKGQLVDGDSSVGLSKASVKLAPAADSTAALIILADSAGNFGFTVQDTGKYIISLSYTGYDNGTRNVTVRDADIDLGEVLMFRKIGNSLQNVVVVGRTPPARQKGDTTELNAAAFKVNPDATVEDLIKKAPGITVENGQVTAQGEQVQRVTIDGRQYFGDDAAAALRNLPADIVDKIQVFDRLSDQSQLTGFDDGNAQKSINIVTKANMRNGQFGRIYAGYGTDDRYAAGGSVNFFNGNKRLNLVGLFNNVNQQNFGAEDLLGVNGQANQGARGGGGGPRGGGGMGGARGGFSGGGGMGGFGGGNNFFVGQSAGIAKTNAIGANYSDLWGKKKNMEFTGSYFFNNSNTAANSTINTEQLMPGDTGNRFSDEVQRTGTRNTNHRMNARFEYKIDSNNTLIISPNLSFQNNNASSISDLATRNSKGALINTLVNGNERKSDAYNFRNDITYRHSFRKRGRSISVNMNMGANKRDNNTQINGYSGSYAGTDVFLVDTTQQQTSNLSSGYNLSTNIAYSEPLGKKGQLQVNYNPQYTKSKADQQTLAYDKIKGNYSIFDTTQSNLFDNDVTAHNAGVNYRIGDFQTGQFSVGVNYQNTRLNSQQQFPQVASVNKTYNNWLPNIMFSRRFANKADLRLNYRASVSAPSVNQLQNVFDKTRPLFPRTGNENLDQSYTHRVFARYNVTNALKGSSFFANVFVQKVDNFITNATFLPSADSILPSGDVVPQGGQLTKPINMDGYWAGRAFFTYGIPIKLIKTNFNLNAGFNYNRMPGQVDYVNTVTNNYVYSLGTTLASNISEYVDFNLSYSANFNKVTSTITDNSNFYFHVIGAKVNLLSKNGWFLLNDVTNQVNSGYSEGFNQNFWLWNVSAGKKFLKNNRGELKLSVFDLLKQNQSITRTVSETSIQDVQTDVLRQYFMLTFTYSLKNFGKGAAAPPQRSGGEGEWRGRPNF